MLRLLVSPFLAVGAGIGLVTAVAAPAAAQAAAPLRVERAVVSVDRGVLLLDVRCARACAGVLGATADAGRRERLVRGKRVRLPARRTQRVALRLVRDALDRVNGATPTGETPMVRATLGGRSARHAVRVDVTCRSGATVAASPEARVLRVRGWGVYACARRAGRPFLLREEDAASSVGGDAVGLVRAAGPFVAFEDLVVTESCSTSTIVVADVRVRRTVRSQQATTRASAASGCAGTTSVGALVLRPSGAAAWSELPGDEGLAAVVALDPAGGTRVLDRAADLDPRSLRAQDAATIAWTRGGVVQVAPLG